jgi:hypothetical protein
MLAADQLDLFDAHPARERMAQEAALARDVAIARGAAHVERVAPSWREQALAAVRAHALEHRLFLMEDCHGAAPMPEGIDPRAWGAIAQEAKRRGWVHPHGYAPANSSNRSPKVSWLSLLYFGDRP